MLGVQMNVSVSEYKEGDIDRMMLVWNEVVDDGIAFPQMDKLSGESAVRLFAEQSFTAVAKDETSGEVLGLYILHPNNIGRCGHISNASYAVKSSARGLGIGKKLVVHSLEKGKELGFKIMQFNAVVKTNYGALSLYDKLGFVRLGTIPGGFFMKDGRFEDIVLFYRML
ncbi:MAG: GNAT family N-acetyltransferase [Treponema sp.]|jgi:ribosomal protein S18 acetylase RimI-like enzyme|nr:GNAT family N-acetyltransferase [Treponema sp.]